jgi:hypothetical protein
VATNPFIWTGVIETETLIQVIRVNALDANSIPEEMGTFEKPQPSPALAAAMKTQAGKIFLDFARFPWAQVDESEQGYIVSLRDLRFYRPSAQSQGFTLKVELDNRLQVRSEAFYFAGPRVPGHD